MFVTVDTAGGVDTEVFGSCWGLVEVVSPFEMGIGFCCVIGGLGDVGAADVGFLTGFFCAGCFGDVTVFGVGASGCEANRFKFSTSFSNFSLFTCCCCNRALSSP